MGGSPRLGRLSPASSGCPSPDDDQEVSIVLRHFRSKPSFLQSSTSTQTKSTATGKEFASILYKDQTLKAVYLHRGSHRLEFHMSMSSSNPPYQIRFIPDKYFPTNTMGFELDTAMLNDLCAHLSTEYQESESESPSLFLILSRLLLRLQKLDIGRRVPQTVERSTANMSVIQQAHIDRLASHRRSSWDWPLVLMRCAATSRKSTMLCTPLPTDLNGQPTALFGVRDDLVRLSSIPTTSRTTPAAALLSCDEQATTSFLASLQWPEMVHVSTKRPDTVSSTSSRTPQNRQVLQVTLDVSQAKDPSPQFARSVLERGTVTGYHGTSVDNIWSILNHGLLSHSSLQTNGAMLGHGVYLSTAYHVAYFFATSHGTATKGLSPHIWCRRSSFWNALFGGGGNADKSTSALHDAIAGSMPHGGPTMMNPKDCTVTCYAVVEAAILLPPPNIPNRPNGPNGEPPPRSNSGWRSGPSSSGSSSSSATNKNCSTTRQEGKYYVVPNPAEELHVQKIHLTVEFIPRRRLLQGLLLQLPTGGVSIRLLSAGLALFLVISSILRFVS